MSEKYGSYLCRGTRPSPRSNHVATLYDDKTLFIFGGASKSRTLNDMYSLDFETVCKSFYSFLAMCYGLIVMLTIVLHNFQMVWSRIKIRGFHPSPRAGCCGVLCGTKWYIAGGGSRKKSMPYTGKHGIINFDEKKHHTRIWRPFFIVYFEMV